MIITIKYNLITRTYYVYRSGTSTVQLRKQPTKAMVDFMSKRKKVTKLGNFVTYT